MNGLDDLRRWNFFKFLDQGIGDRFLITEGHKGITENGFSTSDLFHIILDIFRIRGNDWTVIVIVCLVKFLPFIEQRRVEDKVYLLVDQPLHMSVCQLGRIALGFTGNGFNTKLIDLVRGQWGKDNPVAEACKERKPERIVFIHVQDSGDTDIATLCLVSGKRFVVKYPL